MAKKNKGYIPLWRDIQDHWLWQSDAPFDDRSAWIDLLLSVNHEENKIQIGKRIQPIKAGQMWTSYVKLSTRWKWSRSKVYRYIKMLKSDGMIYTDETPNGTLLTLVNYDSFALVRNTNKTSNDTSSDTPSDTSSDTSSDTQTIMIDKLDNEKNEEEKRRAALIAKMKSEGWQ